MPEPKDGIQVDLDRGVTAKMHPSGLRIYMYKDAPGLYYTVDNLPAARSLAAAAGFDVPKHVAQKKYNDRLAKAKKEADKMLADAMKHIESQAALVPDADFDDEEDVEGSPTPPKVEE